MKLVSVVGTRPNFVKEVLVNRRLRALGVEEVLVHAGQHYDANMSDVFFDQMEIPEPNYRLTVPTGSHAYQTAAILTQLEDILIRERPNVTLVYGDVNTTLAAALASAKLRIPVAHVESGIRTPARFNPEEINRRLTDHLSDLLFTNTRPAEQALLSEGFAAADVVFSGDVLQDLLEETVRTLRIDVKRGDYHVATVHRAENVDSPERLGQIVRGLTESGQRILFPVHPRTRNRLEAFGLLTLLRETGHVELLPPLGYRDFTTLLAGADKVLTDSGGVRREAYLLGKPVLILIDIIWFPEIAEAGWKTIVGADSTAIQQGLVNFSPEGDRPPIFGDGHAHERIVDSLIARYAGRDGNDTSEVEDSHDRAVVAPRE
jgi:UDP-N-acetylglucosamine 2-epimerase (non-hydrolysing)